MSAAETQGLSEPIEVCNPAGTGQALILCEHASHYIPQEFHDLGMTPEDLESHAAWDPGARAVAGHLSRALDAPLVASRISRLVYDCNRPPEAPSAMPERSELIGVPGNAGLSQAQRDARADQIYRPFCEAVSAIIKTRQAKGRPTALITVHSFTPVYFGKARTVELGILHDRDSRLADAMLAEAGRLPHRRIERNAPYGPADGVTHSLKLHGIANGLPNVMLEIRNDLLHSPEAQAAMAQEVLRLLTPALAELTDQGELNA